MRLDHLREGWQLDLRGKKQKIEQAALNGAERGRC